jgi:hypothetical protein
MKGREHWKLQVPLQTGIALRGAPQAVPHFPQLDVSLVRLTHDPLQFVWVPHSVVQAEALHTVPAPQTVAHLPQWLRSDCKATQELPQSV